MDTVASGITAPVGSVTVPRREVVACECATEIEITDAKKNTATDLRQSALLITPPEKQESSLVQAHLSVRGWPRFLFSFQLAVANIQAPYVAVGARGHKCASPTFRVSVIVTD